MGWEALSALLSDGEGPLGSFLEGPRFQVNGKPVTPIGGPVSWNPAGQAARGVKRAAGWMDRNSPAERLKRKGVSVVGGTPSIIQLTNMSELADGLEAGVAAPHAIAKAVARGGMRAVEAIYAGIADQDRAYDMMTEYEDFVKFLVGVARYGWQSRSPLYSLVSVAIGYLIAEENGKASGFAADIGADILRGVATRSRVKAQIIENLVSAMAARYGNTGLLAKVRAKGVSTIITIYQLLGWISQASAARRRLRLKHPKLHNILRSQHLDMGWIFVEPHFDKMKETVRLSGVANM